MLPALGAIGPIAKMVGGILDKAVPDKDLKEKLKQQLRQQAKAVITAPPKVERA